MKIAIRLAMLSCLLGNCANVFAQGCVMCRESAAASPAAARFNLGILILLLPAVLLFVAIIILLYFSQNKLSSLSAAPRHNEQVRST